MDFVSKYTKGDPDPANCYSRNSSVFDIKATEHYINSVFSFCFFSLLDKHAPSRVTVELLATS